MTVIRPNSISGITSLTAHRGSIDFYAHDGSAARFNNINSNVTSGVSTFASLNITGDLDVGGALTYEDVTNVDSIGVVTARNGIDVTGGTVTVTTGANSASPAGSGDNLVIKDSNGCGLSILSGNGNSQNIYLGSVSDNDAVRLEGFYNSGSPYFNIYTANSERLRITSNGQSKFTVGTNKYVKIYAASHNDEADLGAGIAFSRPSDGADMLSGMFAHSNTGLGIAARDHITFLTGGTSNVSDTEERVRIDSVGNMGIGGAPLPTTTGYNGATLHLRQSAGSGGSSLRMTNGSIGHTTSDGFYMGYWDDGHLYCFNQEAGHIIVGTNGTERLRIDSSGCVRVGNTHSQTTSSNTKRIALGAKGSIWGWTSGNINGALTLADNYYWDGSNNRAIEADNAAFLSLRSGSLRFGTTDSTPSAGGITGLTEKFRITSDGELLIGETSSGGACKLGMSFGNSTGNYIEMGGTSRTANGLSKLAVMRHGYWGGAREVGSLGFLTSSSSGGAGRGSGNFVVHTGTSGNGDGGLSADNPSIERTRVDSDGIFYVNTSSANNWSQTNNSPNTNNSNGDGAVAGNMCFRTSQGALVLANDADSGYSAVYINKYDWNSGDDTRWINFYLNGSGKDSITWNGSNIVYGNNSDYRIKTNIRSYTGGINLVKQIQVRQYDYIETERGTDHVGFIAHELQEVLPDAVSGEKDGMRIEEETGEEVMDIQNVDYGRVTPILTAALKEAIAKIEALEARITALEG